MKQPKGIKGFKKKLRQQTLATNAEIRRAMKTASKAIDQQSQELSALRRILISERAQVIYYTEKYRAMVMRECLDVAPKGFLDLKEDEQTKYIKQAIQELNSPESIVPHSAPEPEKGIVH